MTNCLRYSAAAPAGDPSHVPGRAPRSRALRPDGRWRRILEALDRGPMTKGRLLAVTDPGKHARRLESLKIYSALLDLAALGLVRRVTGGAWARTALGDIALDQLRLEQPDGGGEHD